MIISDLNYLETANESVQGGFTYEKNVDVDVNIKYDVNKYVKSRVNIKGNLATSDSVAQAFGDNTLAETEAYTFTAPDYSESFSGGVSATY